MIARQPSSCGSGTLARIATDASPVSGPIHPQARSRRIGPRLTWPSRNCTVRGNTRSGRGAFLWFRCALRRTLTMTPSGVPRGSQLAWSAPFIGHVFLQCPTGTISRVEVVRLAPDLLRPPFYCVREERELGVWFLWLACRRVGARIMPGHAAVAHKWSYGRGCGRYQHPWPLLTIRVLKKETRSTGSLG